MRPWAGVTETGDIAADMYACVVALLARYSVDGAMPPIALVDMERVGSMPQLHSAIAFSLADSGERLLKKPLNKLSQEVPSMARQQVMQAKVGCAHASARPGLEC